MIIFQNARVASLSIFDLDYRAENKYKVTIQGEHADLLNISDIKYNIATQNRKKQMKVTASK